MADRAPGRARRGYLRLRSRDDRNRGTRHLDRITAGIDGGRGRRRAHSRQRQDGAEPPGPRRARRDRQLHGCRGGARTWRRQGAVPVCARLGGRTRLRRHAVQRRRRIQQRRGRDSIAASASTSSAPFRAPSRTRRWAASGCTSCIARCNAYCVIDLRHASRAASAVSGKSENSPSTPSSKNCWYSLAGSPPYSLARYCASLRKV